MYTYEMDSFLGEGDAANMLAVLKFQEREKWPDRTVPWTMTLVLCFRHAIKRNEQDVRSPSLSHLFMSVSPSLKMALCN